MDSQSWRSDEDRIDWARAVLTSHGVPAGPSGYDEATVARAIQSYGWDYSFTGVTGAWTAEVFSGPAAAPQSLSSVTWEDRETALLLAFAIALHAEAQG